MSPARSTLFASAAAFAVSFCVYLRTLHPGVPGPDSGDLIAVARVLGVAHPPGYPLYTMLAHVFALAIPWGGYAWKINLLSAVLHGMAAGLLCATVGRLTGRAVAGLAASLALAFSRSFWKVALVAEVFPLNSLMAALLWFAFSALLRDAGLLAAAGRRRQEGAQAGPWPLAVLIVVSAAIPAHQHTLLMLALPLDAVALALVLLPETRLARWLPGYRRPYALGPLHAAAGLGLTLLGLAPLAFLPLAAARHPALYWGRPDTPAGFVALLTRADYGSFNLAAQQPGQVADVSHGWLYLQAIPPDFAWVGAVLAAVGAIGLVIGARRSRGRPAADSGARPLLIVVLGAALLQGLFFSRVPFSSDVPYLRGVVEHFYVLPHITVALLAGIGVAALLAWLPGGRRGVTGLAIAGLAGVSPLVAHFKTLDQRGNRFIEDLGRNVLASLPPNAVMFSVGDIVYNSLSYLMVVEGERPDVVMVDEPLLKRAWYVRSLRRAHPGLLPPFTERAEPDSDRYTGDSLSATVRWIDHLRGRRPIAFTRFLDRSYSPRYEMVQNGLVMVPQPRGEAPPSGAHVRAAARLLESLRLDSFFRGQDPRGPEVESRPLITRFLSNVCFLLCGPEGREVRRAEYPGLGVLAVFLERFERLDPMVDPELLRAAGFLHVYHPDFRDRALAVKALGRYLATDPGGPEAVGASRLLEVLRRGE